MIELIGPEKSVMFEEKPTLLTNQIIIATLKHDGKDVKIWGCFTVSGHGQLHNFQGNMNFQFYQQKLHPDLLPSVSELRPGRK